MFSRSSHLAFVAPILLAVAALTGCGGSGGDGSSTPPPAPPTHPAPATVTESGQILDYMTHQPIAGATVTAGGHSTFTDSTGTYSMPFESGVPFSTIVSAPGYETDFMQEEALDADLPSGGGMFLVSNATASQVRSTLPGYDETLGSVVVGVSAIGKCASAQGATIEIAPAGAAQVRYFEGGVPSATATSVQEGEFPSAVFYDVQPGVPLSLTVKHAECTQAPYPVTYGNVEFTGHVQAESGATVAYATLFLQ